MFEELKGRYAFGYGVEPALTSEVRRDSYLLCPGVFPDAVPEGVMADRITMLAVLEHLAPSEQAAVVEGCRERLKPGGLLVITVPSPRVDGVLHVLGALRLIDGMSMHEHYGFEAAATPSLFGGPDFKLREHRRFQLGLNNLFVFERTGAGVPALESSSDSTEGELGLKLPAS
jgi:hypothetical protein